ncbi:MAG: hypothetical protein Q9M29_08245 [Mariprofundaceae bacterium]|nr:hypothetical protein [Mariprofundaceae bacterium]
MNAHAWNLDTPEQWLGLFGAILILIAYAITVGSSGRRRLAYAISLTGGLLLLVMAVLYHNPGLVLLESSWVAINVWGLGKVYREEKSA